MNFTVEERVARGAAVLDRKIPGWELRIDTAQLNIASGDKCVVGQLFGSYGVNVSKVLEREELMSGSIATYAFNVYGSDELNEVNHAWRELIVRRRLAEYTSQPVGVEAES